MDIDKTKKLGLPLFVSMVAMFLVTESCHHKNSKQDITITQEMKVKTVSDTSVFSRVSSVIGTHYELGAEVDLPIEGYQPLIDSVRWFVTKELYSVFDWDGTTEYSEEKIHIPFEMVCNWDGDNIVTDFINHYSSLYNEYAIGSGADYLTLKLVSQTKMFVTYYAEYTDCGGSCNHEYRYYTFRKRDGHLLKNMLSDKKQRRFVKKYPQYKVDDDVVMTFMGLSDEGFLYGIYIPFGAGGGYHKIDTIPYVEIEPFLSKETQELILEL